MTTTPSQDAMRAAFEADVKSNPFFQSFQLERRADGAYLDPDIAHRYRLFLHFTRIERDRCVQELRDMQTTAPSNSTRENTLYDAIDRITKGT